MYNSCNKAFGMTHKFLSSESDQWKHVTALGFAPGPSLNASERLPLSINHDKHYCQWQQMLKELYSKMNVNGASTICGFASTVIKQRSGRCYA
jgi:hypothetical protein